jgi:hypothetical protein
MFKVRIMLGILLISITLDLFAKDKSVNAFSLPLQCSIVFSDFDAVENESAFVDVTLVALKHKSGGAVLAYQAKGYEFWVMAHSVQTTNTKKFVNNFQVAIKHKRNKLFMHALSDSSNDPKSPPGHARISLLEYHPGSFLEKGELFFDCKYLESN